MIRQTTPPTTTSEAEDHSMRFAEYALAALTFLAAGILAFLR